MTKQKMKVCYEKDDDDYIPLYVELELSQLGTKIKFIIGELNLIDLEKLKNFVRCMINGQESKTISGGGNSYWCMVCKNGQLNLTLEVSGSGNGCNLEMKIPCDSIINEFTELIEVRKCIENKIRYLRK